MPQSAGRTETRDVASHGRRSWPACWLSLDPPALIRGWRFRCFGMGRAAILWVGIVWLPVCPALPLGSRPSTYSSSVRARNRPPSTRSSGRELR